MKSSFNMGLHNMARLSARAIANQPKTIERSGTFIDESDMKLNRKQRRRLSKKQGVNNDRS